MPKPPYQATDGQWVVIDAQGNEHDFATQAEALAYYQTLVGQAAMAEMQTLLDKELDLAQQLVDGLARPTRVGKANKVTDIITATADGALVPGTSLTKERWLAIMATFESFTVWLNTPLALGLTPQDVISLR